MLHLLHSVLVLCSLYAFCHQFSNFLVVVSSRTLLDEVMRCTLNDSGVGDLRVRPSNFLALLNCKNSLGPDTHEGIPTSTLEANLQAPLNNHDFARCVAPASSSPAAVVAIGHEHTSLI